VVIIVYDLLYPCVLCGSTFLSATGLPAHALTVFGYGGETCGAWTANGTPGTGRDGYSLGQIAWMTGAISEAAILLLENRQVDMLRNTDADALIAWINNYCQQHPLNQLQTAINALIAELLQRATTSQP
jgi:hypothetical protein